MVITAAHITPLVAIIAGILILLVPRLLSYIVAIYLIFIGLVELNTRPPLAQLSLRPCARRRCVGCRHLH